MVIGENLKLQENKQLDEKTFDRMKRKQLMRKRTYGSEKIRKIRRKRNKQMKNGTCWFGFNRLLTLFNWKKVRTFWRKDTFNTEE